MFKSNSEPACRIQNKELYGYWKTFSSFDVDFIAGFLQGFWKGQHISLPAMYNVHVLPFPKFDHVTQFCIFFWRDSVLATPLHMCLNSNSECSRSKRARYQLSLQSPSKKSIFWRNLLNTNQHLGLWINHDFIIPEQWSYPEPELFNFWMLEYRQEVFMIRKTAGARIFKLLRSPRIDSKKSIPPAYVAWWAGMTTIFLLGSMSP